jgi:hypothetical protein
MRPQITLSCAKIYLEFGRQDPKCVFVTSTNCPKFWALEYLRFLPPARPLNSLFAQTKLRLRLSSGHPTPKMGFAMAAMSAPLR